jgi:hypothetical protein
MKRRAKEKGWEHDEEGELVQGAQSDGIITKKPHI